jgi:hypothetical protein
VKCLISGHGQEKIPLQSKERECANIVNSLTDLCCYAKHECVCGAFRPCGKDGSLVGGYQ